MLEMLFDIPKNKLKITVFKEKHVIETHYARGCEGPWAALHMPTAWREYKDYGVTQHDNIAACFSKVGRLLDESGLAGYGDTEAEAIVATCKCAGIPVLPSDL